MMSSAFTYDDDIYLRDRSWIDVLVGKSGLFVSLLTFYLDPVSRLWYEFEVSRIVDDVSTTSLFNTVLLYGIQTHGK